MLITLPYVIEVVRPGWISWKRIGLLALPYGMVVGIYFFVLACLQEPIVKLTGPADFTRSIHRFNVWFRLILFFSVLIYLFANHGLIFRYQAKYKLWCKENFSSNKYVSINWLHYFEIGLYIITSNFMLLLFVGTPAVFIYHQLTTQIIFSFLIYKGLFHKSPYPEGFFNTSMTRIEEELTVQDDGFSDKLPVYADSIKKWFEDSKPYLNPEFKLLDTNEILALNRSYLSRIFNEGMGASFSQVVQQYRIQEVKRLLIAEKDTKIAIIAERCGFLSYSSFHQIFVKQTGMTPNAFRQTNMFLPSNS